MSPALSLAGGLAALALLSRGVLAQSQQQTCFSYGMDFQGGGTYFQNVNSQDQFTFVQEFSGCQNDTSRNLLVDPHGSQYTCTETPLTPDFTDQMSTCPITKSKLYSGAWSILILSNNGPKGLPIAYQRDFSLTVGPQSTTTVTPTITSTVVVPSIINVTSTTTGTETTTLPPSTTTVPSTTIQKTRTITPAKVWTTKTIDLATITIPKFSVTVTKEVTTKTASCHLPKRQSTHDPILKIMPTDAAAHSIAMVAATAVTTSPPSAKFRRVRDTDANLSEDREKWLQERADRLEAAAAAELDKRAPDPQPLTVTEQDVSKFVTSTVTSLASPVTNTVISTIFSTSTVTPAPITIVSGQTVVPPATVTAPTPTGTKTKFDIAVTTTTKIQTLTVKITTTVSPAASKTACRSAGGLYW